MKTTPARRGPSLAVMATAAADLEARKRYRAISRQPLNSGKVRWAERNESAYRRIAATSSL